MTRWPPPSRALRDLAELTAGGRARHGRAGKSRPPAARAVAGAPRPRRRSGSARPRGGRRFAPRRAVGPNRRLAGAARLRRRARCRLSRLLAARRRLRAARPLLRSPRHGADVRAPGGGGDGPAGAASGRAARSRPRTTRRSSVRCTPGWTRSRRPAARGWAAARHGGLAVGGGIDLRFRIDLRFGIDLCVGVASASASAWRALAGGDGRRRGLRRRALAAGFPALVAGLNRAGLGPLSADLSSGRAAPGPLGGARRGAAAPRGPRSARRLRPYPSCGPVARRRSRRVAHGDGDDADQRRLAGCTRPTFVGDDASREPLPAGLRRHARSGWPARAGQPPRCGSAVERRLKQAQASPARPGVKQTPWQMTPSPTVSSSVPAVLTGCEISS